MADLNSLFQKKDSSNVNAEPAGKQPASNAFAGFGIKRTSADSPESGAQQGAVAPAQGVGEAGKADAPAATGNPSAASSPFRINAGGSDRPVPPAVAGSSESNAGRANDPVDSGVAAAVVGAASSDGGVSDPFAALNALGNVPAVRESSTISGFADETPANAPTRELPEDLNKEQLDFVSMIDNVYGILHEPEMLSGVIRNIMIELQSNPQYIKLICDEDVRTWVRAMRESMGLARVKKAEKKAGTGRAKKSGKGVDADMLAAFASLGIKPEDME